MGHKTKEIRQAEATLRNTLPRVERLKAYITDHKEYLEQNPFCKYTQSRIAALESELQVKERLCAEALALLATQPAEIS